MTAQEGLRAWVEGLSDYLLGSDLIPAVVVSVPLKEGPVGVESMAQLSLDDIEKLLLDALDLIRDKKARRLQEP